MVDFRRSIFDESIDHRKSAIDYRKCFGPAWAMRDCYAVVLIKQS
jgi:hypothetical protein